MTDDVKLSWLGFGVIYTLVFIDRMRQRLKRRGGRYGK